MTRARDLANIADGTFTATDLDLSGTLTVSGDANFDSGSLFVDVSENKVGIGTSSPSSLWSQANQIVVGGGSGNIGMSIYSASTGNSRLAFVDTTAGNPGLDSGGLISYSHVDDAFTFRVTGSERMRIDSSGNVGIGVTPSAWGSGWTTLQAGASGAFSAGNYSAIGVHVSGNAYYDGTNWKYIATDEASNYYQSDGTHVWRTAASGTAGNTISFSEAMRITSAGNVGIGTSSPAYPLEVFYGTGNQAVAHFSGNPAYTGRGLEIGTFSQGVADGGAYLDAPAATYGTLAFKTIGTERMRIDSSGNVLIGKTSFTYATEGVQFNASTGRIEATASSTYAFNFRRNTTTGIIGYFNYAGTDVGTISTNGTTTAYNTSSDARLKENIADAQDASSLVDAIKVRSFDWKADGSHQRYGMVAQELMTVAPEAVSGDPESDDMMGVDYSKLVPMLVKEIQSLRARVAQLEGA